MSNRNRADEVLRKILGADISTFKTEYLPVEKISPNPYQPRRIFEKEKLEELASSIKEHGVLQPILVRSNASGKEYELIAGERRLRAAQLAGQATIPAIIRQADDQTAKTLALVENIHRENLCLTDKINAIHDLKDQMGSTQLVAKSIGKTVRTVERYEKIYREINSMPEFTEAFNNEPAIDFASAQRFSDAASTIRCLRESNKKEYEKIVNYIKDKGLKEAIKGLEIKFKLESKSKAPSKNKEPLSVNYSVRETDSEYILYIRYAKGRDILPDEAGLIREKITSFLKLTSLHTLIVKNTNDLPGVQC